VWHASVGRASPDICRTAALIALLGVGNPMLGQWEENGFLKGGRAYHVRRRLSEEEARLVGPVKDIRGTPEYYLRLRKVAHRLPSGYSE
jgi:hypothetical protein